jgi:geranylgeranyl reductase family protein
VTAPDETPPSGPPERTPRPAKAPPKATAKKAVKAAKDSGKTSAKKTTKKAAKKATKKAPAKKAPAKHAAQRATSGAATAASDHSVSDQAASDQAARDRTTSSAAASRPSAGPGPVHDVVIVGAGPSGSSCGYWLAEAGWDVVVVERKEFPREKTCGDGLTPRAVRQLADMGLEGALTGAHRYTGLRAYGFGHSMEMQWPEHPNFPNYGYTITRHDLDGLVAGRAGEAGATVLQGTEVIAPVVDESAPRTGPLPVLTGVTVQGKSGGDTRTIAARYVVVADGSNSRVGRMLGTSRRRDLPMGMALRGYYTSDRHDDSFIESHLDIRDHDGNVVPGYGWIFPLGDGRINVGVGLLSTEQRWKGLNTSTLMDAFVGYAPESWGIRPETCLGPPTGGKLPMGLSVGPRAGANVVITGDASGAINPFNGEGIAYGYETGRLAAAALGRALTGEGEAALTAYDHELTAAYGPYYKVARAFVHLISHPEAMRLCVGLGMRSELLMNQLLRIMANLMRPDAAGPAELGFRAMELVSRFLPDDDGIETSAA